MRFWFSERAESAGGGEQPSAAAVCLDTYAHPFAANENAIK